MSKCPKWGAFIRSPILDLKMLHVEVTHSEVKIQEHREHTWKCPVCEEFCWREQETRDS